MSNHPIEQKTVAHRFHIKRMHSLPPDPIKKQKELETIQSIASKNKFQHHLLQKLNHKIYSKTNLTYNRNKDNKRIWSTFTYHSPQIGKITTCL